MNGRQQRRNSMNTNILGNIQTSAMVLVFKVKNSDPVKFVVYETSSSEMDAVAKILNLHPELEYKGHQLVIGREAAKRFASEFNRSISIYFKFLEEYK